MTENEAIVQIEERLEYWDKHSKYLGGIENYLEALRTAVEALKEIQQYRSIGTVDELSKKMNPIKPITYAGTNRADCPICGSAVRGIDKPFGDFCSKCGQKLNWSEVEE